MERRLAGQEQNLKGSLRISSADWFGAYVLPPILADFSRAYPHVDVEILTGTRLFNLAQREADLAFRIVPFNTADVVQRRLFRLEYGVYIAEESPDPRYGDGTGFRLITHETSTGHFPDIAWLIETFPNARPVLRSNNRNVQGRMCRQGVGIAVLPRVVGTQIPGIRRLDLADATASARYLGGIPPGSTASSASSCVRLDRIGPSRERDRMMGRRESDQGCRRA